MPPLDSSSLSRTLQPFFFLKDDVTVDEISKELLEATIFRDEDDGTGSCSLYGGRGARCQGGSRYKCQLIFAHRNDDFHGTTLIFYGKMCSGHKYISHLVKPSSYLSFGVPFRNPLLNEPQSIAIDSQKNGFKQTTDRDKYFGVESDFNPASLRNLLKKNRQIFVVYVELV